jgi:hypothetical protein
MYLLLCIEIKVIPPWRESKAKRAKVSELSLEWFDLIKLT